MSAKFKSTDLRTVAAILPRYGSNLGGGAEALVRELLIALVKSNIIERAEVWTTCATDHRTWDNALPEGLTVEDGITVIRFPVDERDLDTFIHAELAMAAGRPLTIDEQLDWLGAGVNSRSLYSHIKSNSDTVDVMLFAPYLFPTSFWGPLIDPTKSVIVPCLHNESYAYQSVFRAVFESVRGCLFNAIPEHSLASAIYNNAGLNQKGFVVGMGFELPEKPLSPPLQIPGERPYLLYSGRKEKGKNLDLLLEWFVGMREVCPTLELILIGSGSVDFLPELPSGVRDLGFVSESDKRQHMRNAIALCQLSVNESFSIVMMEAWAEQTPVIVHGNGAVPRHHVVSSGGGLYATTQDEFNAAVSRIFNNPMVRNALGRAGYSYVEKEYSWKAVLGRFCRAMEALGFTIPTEHALPQLDEGVYPAANCEN